MADLSLFDLTGQTALVTGASRGIGAATAVELARLGARVVITARTQGGLEETDDAIRALGGEATILPLDLREGGQIDAIGPTLFQRFGRLDILVHNAGAMGRLTPVSHILPDDWSDVVAVRAVFVTESRAREPKAYWGAIGATKAGMEHLALTWAQELATTNVRANLFDPGPVATRMRANMFPGEDRATLVKPDAVAAALAALCLPAEQRNGALVRFE